MSRSPRQLPPSAIQGYQRLRHAAPVDPAHEAGAAAADVAVATGAPVDRLLTGTMRRRVLGAARLGALVAVLAIIVGASVGLASSDATHTPARTSRTASSSPLTQNVATAVTSQSTTAAKSNAIVSARAKAAGSKASVSKETTTKAAAKPPPVAAEVVAEPAPAATVAAAAAPVAAPKSALPFTGDQAPLSVLLFGGLLVLSGMLLQIAGQPLPAARR